MKIVKCEKSKMILFNEIDTGCVFTTKGHEDSVLMKIPTGMNEHGYKVNAICLEYGAFYWFDEDTEVIILDCELVIMQKEM